MSNLGVSQLVEELLPEEHREEAGEEVWPLLQEGLS